MTTQPKKLSEVALPLPEINDASAYDKMPGIRPHPKGSHHWWARRPVAADAPLTLSCAGVAGSCGDWLAACIGACCAGRSEAELARLLAIRDISAGDRVAMKQGVVHCRKSSTNPAAHDAAWREESGDGDLAFAAVAAWEN